MDWPVVALIVVVAIALIFPLWRLQKRAPGRHSYPAQTLDKPAEPGSEGMNVPAAGEVAPGPDEPAR
jgi:hypothetical protein